jgi:site-specific recombinase XerD
VFLNHTFEWWESQLEVWNSEQPIGLGAQAANRTAWHNFYRFLSGSYPSRKLFAQWIRSHPGTDMTIQSYSNCVRRFFFWLFQKGKVPEDITFGVRPFIRKTKDHTRLPLSEDQVVTLLQVIKVQNQPGERDLCIVLLMLHCALRCCEIRRARLRDIYQDHGQWCLHVHGKGHIRPDACVILGDDLHVRIINYIAWRKRRWPKHRLGNLSPIFVTYGPKPESLTTTRIGCRIGYYFHLIGLDEKRYCAHGLRHTAAVLALERGAHLDQVQLLLRHVSSSTTSLYVKYIDRLRDPAEKFLEFLVPGEGDFKVPSPVKSTVLPFKRIYHGG